MVLRCEERLSPHSEQPANPDTFIHQRLLNEIVSSQVRYVGKPHAEQGSIIYPKFALNIERIIAGTEILQRERAMWPNNFGLENWVSGSIGFLDYIELKGDRERFVYIYLIGIEPNHRRQKHATRLLEELESIALGRKIYRIVSSEFCGENNEMRSLMKKLGYAETPAENLQHNKNKNSEKAKKVSFEKYLK